MADLPSPLRLTHMTWPEVERARDGVELVMIPIGSIEQHGPNTSLDTDLVICEDLTVRLAERFHPRLLVAPTMPYGMSTYHMGFPGHDHAAAPDLPARAGGPTWPRCCTTASSASC